MDQSATHSQVSHYKLVRKLGSGGMGDVYLANDLQLGRQVAIKFLNNPTADRPRHRLLNEARAAAALDHPLICSVYEVGHDEGRGDFIVMQYVEGETLARQISRGALGVDTTLAVATDIADALASAHGLGIVHRDLKPQNIMIQKSGRAKLLDFGISKRASTSHQASEATTATPLTGAHALVGTPGYMSPEQVKGQAADGRSDLFALGCVLYECLTGRRAFTGATSGEISGQILHTEPPSPSTLVPGVSPELEALVFRLLRKTPADRFQSASEVVGAIRMLRGLTTAETTSRRTRSRIVTSLRARPRRTAAVAVTTVIVAMAAGVLWRDRSLPVPPPQAAGWYNLGVEALRDGTYAGARAALEEAVLVFPNFPQAYSRLAEAYSELDDENAAHVALVKLGALAPENRLPVYERLRVQAVRAMVLREHAAAIKAYAALIESHPNDAGLRVDAGRAQEAAGQMGAALEHYAKAVAIDPHYAAARLRLGSAEGQAGSPQRAIAEFDEAVRLYRAATRVEGEAEALIRKGSRQTALGDYRGARVSVERAIAITADDRYLPQQTRAQFHLARITLAEGRVADAEAIATRAVSRATAAGLDRDAAEGLIDLSNSFAAAQKNDEASASLDRSIALASGKARRTEMRARLQQAYLRLATGKYADASTMAEIPLKFFSEGRYLAWEAQAKIIISRAKEYLEEYEEARRLATDVLRYAESVDDRVMIGDSLENLAGQSTKLGQLLVALRFRERIETIHRAQGSHSALKFDLPNRAELLIRLGRERDAVLVLDEIRTAMASGNPAYADRARRIAVLTALLSSTGRRFSDVESQATLAIGPPSDTPDGTALFALVLREHARAQLGRSRATLETIVGWLALTQSLANRRELSYWVAQTILARRDPNLALSIASAEFEKPVLKANIELRWRLSAIADRAIRAGATPGTSANYKAVSDDDVRRVIAELAGDATAYFARPDLAALRESR